MDIPHGDLPTSNGNQTYVLELNTTKRSEKGNSALHVTVTVNGVLVRSTALLDDCSLWRRLTVLQPRGDSLSVSDR